jgi:hypothetical protein
VRPLKPSEDPLSGTQIFVVVVSLGTVALWCCNSLVSHVTGEMGVLAILPMGARLWGVFGWFRAFPGAAGARFSVLGAAVRAGRPARGRAAP